jgi:hypothetical protein
VEPLALSPIPDLESRHDLVTANVIEEHSHRFHSPERVRLCVQTQTDVTTPSPCITLHLSVGGA